MPSRLDYRADLDGLRAVAVVSVILFHLGLPYAPGGFVGVDVFFVLSGYLITRQIALELEQGRFSLLDFYDRRIRRLFPALFAMLFLSTIIALFVLLPHDLDRFGESLVTAALSVSNFHFWSKSDYFAPAAESMPLLHTWSLAVEEQFYLLFPPLLMLCWRFARAHVRLSLAILAALSFAISLWGVRAAPDATFYLLPGRAWELLLGSLLALAPLRAPLPSWLRNAATVLGLGGILFAVFTYRANMLFPGLAAVLPALGCALVIWGGQDWGGQDWGRQASAARDGAQDRPLVQRLLAWRPLAFVGLISYSLYLWHWPLIVFARQVLPDPLTPLQAALIALATFAMACVSWKYIEQPLRHGGVRWPTPRLRLRYSSMIVACLALLGMGLDIGNGFPWLQPTAVLAVVDDADDRSPLRKRCHVAREDQGELMLSDTCVFGSPEGRPVIVFGDSHGAELSYALSEIARESGLHVRQITASACPPALGFSPDERLNCPRHTLKMVQALEERPRSTIVLVAHYFVWTRTDAFSEMLWQGLAETVSRLRRAGHDIILTGPWPPHPNGHLPNTLAKEVRFGRPISDYTFPINQKTAAVIDGKLQQLARQNGAAYLPLLQVICGDGARCRGMAEGQSIYFDDDHISVARARDVVKHHLLPALGIAGTVASP